MAAESRRVKDTSDIALRDVAAAFHSFYNAHKIIDDDVSLSLARLALAAATQQVLARGLHILGVSAPEAM